MPSVVSEASVSSHRALHSGKHASGSSQGRDQTTPFEALLDTATPDPAPKKTPKADKPDRPDRPERAAAPRRASEADGNPRDPNAVASDNDPAPDAAKAASDSAATGTEATEPAADAEADTSQTVKTEETADVLAAIAEPTTQPIAPPVVATAIATAPAPAEAADATELTGVTPAAEAAAPDAVTAAPAEAAAPDQAADGIKPKPAKSSAEKSAGDKPAADKAQAQSTTDDEADAAAPDHHDTVLAQKKAAPTADGNAKPEAPAKPRVDPDALRAETDVSPRDHSAKPAADPLQTATLANTQTQAAHSTAGSSAVNGPQQAAPAVPVAGLAVEIAAQARAGKNRFEIRLDPPELGRIDVRLDVDKDGNVTSRLMADRSDTLDLLRRDAHALERALNQAGLKTADNALEFSLRDQGFAHNNNRDGARDGSQLIIPDDESPVLDAARGYGRLLGLGNGLDISV